jgi:spore maturation protein A
MLNLIWVLMLLVSAVSAVINGRVEVMVSHIPINAQRAIDVSISLIGMMAFWLGLMKVAEDGGAVKYLVRLMQPIMRRLFPDVPKDHPAMGAITFSFVSNMLGLNNASIPISIRAMQALQGLNTSPTRASNAMCMFLVITSSSVQLLPTTAISALTEAGSTDSTKIIVPTLIATIASSLGAVVACFLLQGREKSRIGSDVL